MTPTRSSPVVGIDLGTTNCAVAWVDVTAVAGGHPRVFPIPQIVAARESDERAILPSFLYVPTDEERESGAVALPWDPRPQIIAGVFAREHGALVPARQISSAKSWLSNPLVDRRAAILPPIADAPERLSPVDASARLLAHIRDAWNHVKAGSDPSMRLEGLPIVLTVPASFDEEARELTVEAARAVGFDRLTLLEEPLAALYAWMANHGDDARRRLGAGGALLICDVGGGTTDFSLIRASAETDGVRFERTAIGEHLLLGGDNLDLALAAGVEARLANPPYSARLSVTQRQALRRQCSAAKEELLAADGPGQTVLTILGGGRSLVGGTLTASLTRDDVETALGAFLPDAHPADRPARGSRTGLRELGLPYESDPAITRHLAAFLARAARESGHGHRGPDAVLFNGGFFAASAARTRVLDVLERLIGRRPDVLENTAPETAVAIGAARYGALRVAPADRRGLLVRAGSARAYYIGVQGAADAKQAVCVMPRGTEEGSTLVLERELTVVANEPAAFTLFSSLERTDALGDVVAFSPLEPVHRHAALVTALRYGRRSRRVPLAVGLRIVFTEVGTLELWCESLTTEHRWRLQFNLRALDMSDAPEPAIQSDADVAAPSDSVVIAESAVEEAEAILRALFTGATGAPAVEGITGELENVLGHGKHAWPLDVIRRLADVLLSVSDGRRTSARHEARWLNLTGFCLRPGLGAPTDPWRIGEIRRVYAAGPAFPRDTQAHVEWLVLWGRVSAGFSGTQQQELARRMTGLLGLGAKKAARLNPQILREAWRLLGNLERLDPGQRARLGDEALVHLARDPGSTAFAWTMGRFGARTPLYGPLSSVVAPQTAERWLDAMLGLRRLTAEAAAAMVQMAALTGDPVRDIADALRDRVRHRLGEAGLPDETTAPLREIVPPERQDRARLFGEALPEGLRISSEGGTESSNQ